jgi:hypothetical protein
MNDNANHERNLPLQIITATTCITLPAAAWLEQPEVVAANAFVAQAAIVASILMLVALAGAAWSRSRYRMAKRWRAALDAYAEREIARENRWRALKKAQTFSTATGISEKVVRSKKSNLLAT